MTARKTKENDASLPFAALQLLAPPVRLVSAALWKVMEQRDVMHYGVVEEFVTSACETVPGLLTVRHQGKLALGLRARLIMELCSTQPDKKEIMSHLERIRAPAALSTSSATKKRDLKIMNTVEGFQSLVHSLLTDTTRRKHFFKEEFPVDYGPKFDQELEKLLWEFLIRLDQFFPVPNLAQTVSWLSETPSVLEACAQAASQPQLLQTLLQHQTCLGHLETAASLPPNMGDSILSSLYLPPSGKVPSDPPTGATNSFYQSYNTQTRDKTPFIKPVIGLISNEDLGVKKLPEDPSLCSLFVSCLRRQPKVILHKLSVTRASPNRTKSSSVKQQNQRRKSPVQTPTRKLNQTQKPGSERPGLDDKENHPVLPGVIGSPSQQRTNSGTSARPGDTEDYVADSEDEATKNFKVRLFTKRYYKTKHGTYVPTLREYWKPGMARRDLSSAVGKNRR
ncbi:TERF1-interacting nuclear factor 2 [Dissostichus eleginoides]|uniref:TERF1-interacting nuclear factor 2 n=1 Tax=Dissostichus eleginoides TaxID=100907 RepID=A0AAD9BXE9_DISEL|nr:TERF1-interacting nuclear factor 2 [Dissostichus eleginoides]